MHNAYLGMSAALRTEGCYIGPVLPNNSSVIRMPIGPETPVITNPHPDSRSLVGAQRSLGVSVATCEAILLKWLLKDMQVEVFDPTTIYYDNLNDM